MSAPVTLKMLSAQEQAVGRILNVSKKRYTWTFALDDTTHNLTFILSILSQKYSVLIDDQERAMGSRPLLKNLEISVSDLGFHFAIIQNMLNFDMYIDGCLFKEGTQMVVTKEPWDGQHSGPVRDGGPGEPRGKAQTDTGPSEPARKKSFFDNIRHTISTKSDEIRASFTEGTKKLLHLGSKDASGGQSGLSGQSQGGTGEKTGPCNKPGDMSVVREEEGKEERSTSLMTPTNPFVENFEKWKEDALTQSMIQKIEAVEKLEMPLAIVYEQDVESYFKVDFDARTEVVEAIITKCY